MDDEQCEVLTKLAFEIADKVEDVLDEGFIGFVEDNLPKGWEIDWVSSESEDDDCERQELLMERSLKAKKNYEVLTFAWGDSGYRDYDYIIIGAPSFEEVKSFLEELLEKCP